MPRYFGSLELNIIGNNLSYFRLLLKIGNVGLRNAIGDYHLDDLLLMDKGHLLLESSD